MKNYLKFFLGSFCMICISSSSCSQLPFEIIPLPMLTRIDSLEANGKINIYKGESYLVRNFVDTKAAENFIDSFAVQHLIKDYKVYLSYSINFYKETENTTIAKIKAYKKGLPPESIEDHIYEYQWFAYGKNFARYIYRNGEVISSGTTITVTPIDN